MDIIGMLKICISTVGNVIFAPEQNYGFFFIFIFIIYMQYRKNVYFQEVVYGKPRIPLSRMVLTSVLFGIGAGLFISVPMTLLGISFSENMGVQYLILISIALMLFEPRFICFSYSGGILSLVGLVFGLKSIDPTGILMLVAILHLLESVLMYFDGHNGAVPVFFQAENGRVVGGFSMQRYWPIPLALIMFAGYSVVSTAGSLPTPDWWPIFKPSIDPLRISEALFYAMPIPAIIGYSDFTSSCLPKEKCRNSAYKLALFSLALLFLSIVSSYVYAFKFIAALFAPLAHEYLIEHQKRKEKKGTPLFAHVEDGLKILDTLPGGVAEKMGMQPGETITTVNNKSIRTEVELENFFSVYIPYVWVEVKDRGGNIRTLEYKNYNEGIDSLDVLIVPESNEGLLTVKEGKSYIRRLFEQLILKNK
jgi:hypothetical protein